MKSERAAEELALRDVLWGCQVIKRKLQLAAYANFYAKIVFVNRKMCEIVTIVLFSSAVQR